MSRAAKKLAALDTKPRPPGSPAAVLAGCTCSPLANNYGRGIDGRYAVADDCQMHKQPEGGAVIHDVERCAGALMPNAQLTGPQQREENYDN